MDKRILLGSIAALALMLGFELVVALSGRALDMPVNTGIGHVPVIGLLVTFGAMTLGGWIATHGFRVIALLLAALIAVFVTASLQFSLVLASQPMGFGLAEIMRYNALATALSLLVAWLGASVGQRLATQRPERPGPQTAS